MKGFLKWLAGVLATIFLLFFIGGVILSAMVDDTPQIPESGYLYINLSGSIPDFATVSPLTSMLEGTPVSVYGIYDVLYKGAFDDRVKGVVFKSQAASISTASLDEIIEAVHMFRERSGKPVYFYSNLVLNKDLYLAAACDSAFVLPEGLVAITGLSATSTFYKDGLAKLGIQADFIPIGTYKNAPDTYLRNSMSEDQKEVLNDILDVVWPKLLNQFAEKSGKSSEEFAADIKKGIFDAFTLADMGYVDRLIYRDNLMDILGDDDELISFSEYLRVSRKSLGLYKGNSIALIFATGAITTGSDRDDPVLGTSIGSSRVTADIRRAVKDKSVKAIVMRIDSPGGFVHASDIIWRELKNAREEKPVIISVGSLLASGGYYIAMGGDSIIAHPTSIVGSIGVFSGKFVINDLLENKLGIRHDGLKRGEYGDIYSLLKPFSPQERAILSNKLRQFYARFVQKVADNRNMSFDDVDAVAQGRVWIGDKIISTGLVDSYGSLTDAMRAAVEKAGLNPDDDYKWKVFPKAKDFLTELQERSVVFYKSPLEIMLDNLYSWTNRPGLFAWYPYYINIQ